MDGNLSVWGNDENGYWKRTIYCNADEIEEVLGSIENYEDYDFQYTGDYIYLQ